ncbi:MAG TPA: hypothetical protein VEW03_00690 [Longimicrobiaceae bacterium]|nr:hypothetical protein [Longimicrobiaceae bacterium]
MASRVFTDRAGVRWTVWNVVPGEHSPASRHLASLPEDMSSGWLCFESTAGKKRLYQVPPDWAELDDSKLDLLCWAAVSVDRPSDRRAAQPDSPSPP